MYGPTLFFSFCPVLLHFGICLTENFAHLTKILTVSLILTILSWCDSN